MRVRKRVRECVQVSKYPANNAKLWTISTVAINLDLNFTMRDAEQRYTAMYMYNSSLCIMASDVTAI